jgi:thioredoxin-related protein
MKLSSLIILAILCISIIPFEDINFKPNETFAFDHVRNEGYIAFIANEEIKQDQDNSNTNSECECNGSQVITHGDGHKTPCPCLGIGECKCSSSQDQKKQTINNEPEETSEKTSEKNDLQKTVSEDKTAEPEYDYFVYHLGANWCGPCQLLKKNTWSSEKIKTFFEEKKIKLFTFEQEDEKNSKFFDFYKPKVYPTVLLLKSNEAEKPIATYTGYVDADTMISKFKQVIK